jgi:hypothetical protein
MMNFEPHYKYVTREVNGNKQVIAISSYAGKTVKGVATCSPDDNFSQSSGEKLATARCGVKIATKRHKRATEKLEEAERQFEMAKTYLDRMKQYESDSKERMKKADKYLNSILSDLK